MVRKPFKTAGITLALDGSEVKILIGHYPILKEYQVMAEQIEQPADEQGEGINDALNWS